MSAFLMVLRRWAMTKLVLPFVDLHQSYAFVGQGEPFQCLVLVLVGHYEVLLLKAGEQRIHAARAWPPVRVIVYLLCQLAARHGLLT